MQIIWNHLWQPCDHVFVCWAVKVLAGIGLIALSLFVGRIEAWFFSSGTPWEEFLVSLSGTMDNILFAVITLAIHVALFFALSIAIRLFYLTKIMKGSVTAFNATNINTRRQLLSDLRRIIGAIFFSASCILSIVISGLKARLLIWLFLRVEWAMMAINFGTGRNFALNVILGITSLLVDTLLISLIKRVHNDWKDYQNTHTIRVLCY